MYLLVLNNSIKIKHFNKL